MNSKRIIAVSLGSTGYFGYPQRQTLADENTNWAGHDKDNDKLISKPVSHLADLIGCFNPLDSNRVII
jgi:hypothetical protein